MGAKNQVFVLRPGCDVAGSGHTGVMPEPSEVLPSDSVSPRLEKLTRDFAYEVAKATFALVQVLTGLERMHHGKEDKNQVLRPTYLDVSLCDYALPADPDPLCRGGDVEQFAYRSWLIEVASLVERFRPEVRDLFKQVSPSAIQPETPVLGDLNRMRNDLLHNKRIASQEQTGRCEVLKWFDVGDAMVFEIWHVLDFLNQYGIYGSPLVIAADPSNIVSFHPWTDELVHRNPIPRAVSARIADTENTRTGEMHRVIRLVYDNGRLAPCDLGSLQGTLSAEIRQDGRVLAVPELGMEHSTDLLYTASVEKLGDPDSPSEFHSPYGPPIRISR